MSGDPFDPLTFFQAVQTFDESGKVENSDLSLRLATIDAAYLGTGNPKVVFDGEATATTKTFAYLGTPPPAGARVLMAPVGSTWLIIGALNQPAAAKPVYPGPIYAGAQTSGTTIQGGTWTPVDFDAERIDTHNGHDNASSPSRWIVPPGWAGYYRASGGTLFQTGSGTANSLRAVAIALNGARLNWTQGNINADLLTVQAIPTELQLAPGDYLELHGYQNATAARTTLAAQTAFNVEYLRPL